MTLLGVLAKDLLSRMRTWRTMLVVGLHLATLSGIALGLTYAAQVALPGAFAFMSGPLQGPQLFNVLASFELLLIVFLAPALTATAISGERERRTFELLLLTRLSGAAIVAGKLLGALAFLLVLIAGSLPVFSLVFLFGDVAPQALGRVYLLYAAVATTLAAIGVSASALTRRTQTSTAVSYALAFALVFGTTFATTILNVPRPGMNGTPPSVPIAAWLAAAANPLVALLSLLPNPSASGVVPFIQFLPVPAFLTSFVQPPALPRLLQGPLWRVYLLFAAIASLLLLSIAAWAVRRPQIRRPRP
jgi:ABC-2 type transport system permease protein